MSVAFGRHQSGSLARGHRCTLAPASRGDGPSYLQGLVCRVSQRAGSPGGFAHGLRNEMRRAGRWASMRLEDTLLSFSRMGQVNLIEQQRRKRGIQSQGAGLTGKTSERRRKRTSPVPPDPISQTQAMWRPREVAKASGIPKSIIETTGAAFERALRARRSFQERRQWARSARESSRIGGG